MDDSFIIDEKSLESEINKWCLEALNQISANAEKILHDAIQTEVYDYYRDPKWYHRTYALLNSVRCDVSKYMNNNYTLHVYVDTNLLNYMSAFEKRNNFRGTVANAVPYWVDKGHSGTFFGGGDNQFDNYRARNYVEKAFQDLNRKYGGGDLNIQIDEESFNNGSW